MRAAEALLLVGLALAGVLFEELERRAKEAWAAGRIDEAYRFFRAGDERERDGERSRRKLLQRDAQRQPNRRQ